MDARSTNVIVVGAGITGICAAHYLRKNGIPFEVLEAADDVGGIWHSQRWHGIRCDSDFIKYSFSFKPYLSGQCLQDGAEIQRYLRSVAREFNLLEHIHFGARVEKAAFDPARKRWTVDTSQGVVTSQFLINGNGFFAAPHLPQFPDAGRFRGELIHTTDLDRQRTFTGKDLVLVGSGSTAICCAPELARVSKSLTLLQRSPSYIYEISNRADHITLACQDLYDAGFKLPLQLLREYLQLRDDMIFVGFRRFPRLARRLFRNHWRGTVGEQALREHFSPCYNPWEQRIPIAVGFKERLRRGEIVMKTGEIERFTENGLVLKGGKTLPCDVCVLATGLELKLLKFDLYVGDSRVEFAGVNFYKSLMMGAVPNYFHPFGTLHSAWTQRSETVIRHAVKIMTYMKERNFHAVSIERKEVDGLPSILPNYIRRHLPALPRPYGSLELAAIDKLLFYNFDPHCFNFS